MSEPAPVAPATEPVAPTTPEPAPAPAPEPTTPEPAPAPATEPAYFTPEQLKEMEVFYRNNGGYEKVFNATKSAISRPQSLQNTPQQPQTTTVPSQAVEAPQPASTQATQPTAGTVSMEEMAALNYFDRLAGMDQYKNDSEYIRSGEVLKDLKKFNISPVVDGRINDAAVREFLDYRNSLKPPVPTSATPTADVQIDYVPIKEVKTMDEATKIQLQNIQLRAEGKPLHPATESANAFVKAYYSNDKK